MAIIYGDTEGILDIKAKAQTLTGISGEDNFLVGDAYRIYNSKGGNDELTGGTGSAFNALYGDTISMINSRGGNDALTGGTGSQYNFLYGDASFMINSRGGNDVLTAGTRSQYNFLYGDALTMSNSQGGNDVLTGGTGSQLNYLYGDAYFLVSSRGGNDVLTGGTGSQTSYLYGDAKYHYEGITICGNDRLISATGNDDMWGDVEFSFNGTNFTDPDLSQVTTGHDVFVFSANNGTDTIHDFRHGEDIIELHDIGSASFGALISGGYVATTATDTVITFGTNTITVIGVTDLSAADFLFT